MIPFSIRIIEAEWTFVQWTGESERMWRPLLILFIFIATTRTALAEEEIDEVSAQKIEKSGLPGLTIRSVLTCKTKRGLCRMCFGRNLATGEMVEMGEAVGVLAAQCIGEPGTQLTMRTFHIGGPECP